MSMESIDHTDPFTWAVLVAGEVHTRVHLGSHASVVPVAEAYAQLRAKGMPRDRIIVLAQLEECRNWHLQDEELKLHGITDPTRRATQQQMWREKRDRFFELASTLIDEGGADYDGEAVNTDTLLSVVMGDQSASCTKVVQYVAGKTKVFLSLFSHGNWHGQSECHYFYMPYPSATVLSFLESVQRPHILAAPHEDEAADQALLSTMTETELDALMYPLGLPCEVDHPIYGCINSFLSLKKNASGEICFEKMRLLAAKQRRNRLHTRAELNRIDACSLHWQYVFLALRRVFSERLPAAFFVFQQSCGSGGMWSWLRNNEAYNAVYGCDKWPLFVAYTAEPETSAVGSVWSLFHQFLNTELDKSRCGVAGVVEAPLFSTGRVLRSLSRLWQQQQQQQEIRVTGAGGMEAKYLTLQEFYEKVAERYYDLERTLVRVNFHMTAEERRAHGFQRFGVLGTAFGSPFETGPLSEMTLRDFFYGSC